MPKTLVNRAAQIALVVAILTLLAAGIASYRGLALSEDSERRVRHAHEVLESVQGLLAATQSVESSARGFALTGEASYLPAFQSGVARSSQYADTLRRLVADNPEQQQHVAALESLVEQKVRFGEQVLDLRRRSGLEAAAAAIGTGTGQRLMQELEGVVGTLRNEEWRLVALRNADAKQRLRQAKSVLIVGDLVGLLVAVGAFVERPPRQLAATGGRGRAAGE